MSSSFKPTKPTWQSDATAKACFLCDSQFTFFLRRHHCRSCGRVVCNECSLGRANLPQYGYSGAQRICDVCQKGVQLHDSDKDEVGGAAEFANDRLLKYWIRMATDTSLKRDLLHRARCGMPNAIRGVVWFILSGGSEVMNKNVGLYTKLLERELEESILHSIQSDVGRTFPSHPKFTSPEGQAQLFNVLKAYSNFKQYVQNMSYIAGVLLMYLDEESAFWVFAQLMKHYNFQPLFEHAVPDSIQDYGAYVRTLMPDLHRHFHMQGLCVEIFVSQWLRTLFAQQFDLALVVRVWDLMFVEGYEFIFKVPLAILRAFKPGLLEMTGSDLIFFLKGLPQQVVDYDELISMASQMSLQVEPLQSSGEIPNEEAS